MTQSHDTYHDPRDAHALHEHVSAAHEVLRARPPAKHRHAVALRASWLTCLLMMCTSLACSTSDVQCSRWRRFNVDAEITGDDALRACITFGKPHYDEYGLAEMDRAHRLCPGETIPTGVAPNDAVFVEYVPTCEEICWIRQQRIVEETGTGVLGLDPSYFVPGVRGELYCYDSLIREVATCESTVDLPNAIGAEGVLGEVRCSGSESFECGDSYSC